MQNVQTHLSSPEEIHKLPQSRLKILDAGNASPLSLRTYIKEEFATKKLNLTLSLTKQHFAYLVLHKSFQKEKISTDNIQSLANHYISLIEDPLWKSVCTEMTDLMGSSSVQKMWDSKLGAFCSESKSINLCCPTDEAAQFVNQYSFLILGSLQRYFPAIKTLKTKVEYAILKLGNNIKFK